MQKLIQSKRDMWLSLIHCTICVPSATQTGIPIQKMI